MNERPDFSDQVIDAYVDGELGPEERRELLEAASRSDGLSRRICEAGYLKELVRSAYPESPDSVAAAVSSRSGWGRLTGYALAAGLGALSLLSGMSLMEGSGFAPERLASSSPAMVDETPGVSVTNPARVLFHVSSGNPEVAEEMLDQVELVLREYADEGRELRVEVVANNQGLRLLQTGRSPVAARIGQLGASYPNLQFAACGNTLQRFSRQQGENITLLPQVVIVQSGVSFVARRQQQGWAYIKV